MRFLPLLVVGGFALVAVGCGLDANGLGSDDGGATLTEAAAPPVDGTFPAEGAADVTAPPPDTGPTPEDGSGEDVATAEDAPEDVESADGGEDSGTDTGADSSTDAGADSSTDAGSDTGTDSGGADAGDDAADSACPGTCTVAAVPSGWTIVEFEDTASTPPACSTGYSSSQDVVEGPSGAPATCGCACNLTTTGTCETGNFTVYVGGILGCTTGPYAAAVNDGGCSSGTSGDYRPNLDPKMQVDPAPYAAGACTPSPSVSTTPVTFSAQGRLCTSTGAPVGTCPNGGSCATTPESFNLCIKHDGTQTCPTGFTNPPHIVGTTANVADTRGCTACSCGTADAGCSGSITFFTDTGCTAGAEATPVNATCNTFPGPSSFSGPAYSNYEYSAQAQDEGCPPSPVVPDGGVGFATSHTVCCQ